MSEWKLIYRDLSLYITVGRQSLRNIDYTTHFHINEQITYCVSRIAEESREPKPISPSHKSRIAMTVWKENRTKKSK